MAAGGLELEQAYARVRAQTEQLAEPLSAEDQLLQSMPDASPTKWHRAHTTWFFETFVLKPSMASFGDGYREFHPRYGFLFNSYYNAIGERHDRPRRGILSRPPLADIAAYRAHVDEHMGRLLLRLRERPPDGATEALCATIEVGVHHEQQHQELLLTDILHAFASQPLRPAYRELVRTPSPEAPPLRFVRFEEGVREIGHRGAGFGFDNERPRHRVFVEAFELGSRLVTCGEYRAFVADGGYARPELWLSEGWDVVRANGWKAPLYWEEQDGGWWTMSLSGMRPVRDADPVCHVSYYEADAYARWANARLPTEAEWEIAAEQLPVDGNLAESGALEPLPATGANGLQQLFGDVWEWTQSPYTPYPGFHPAAGAIGEYNGKFMVNQQVLRGGSCATPKSHLRASYRNFFPAHARWQFMGLRLARDAS